MNASTCFPFDLQRWTAEDLANAIPQQRHRLAAAGLDSPVGYRVQRPATHRSYMANATPRLFLVG